MSHPATLCLSATLLWGACLTACNSAPSSGSAGSESDSAAVTAAAPASSPEKKWETDTVVRAPESVLWDAGEGIFYVSDINGDGSARDGNGFISKVSPDGTVKQLHWADGLDAPKGLGMYKDEVYAADLSQLVILDKKSGKIKKKLTLPGATFLNDIAVDDEGNVYVSDTRQGKIYRYRDGKAEVFLGGDEVKGANGLLAEKGSLWMLTAAGISRYDFSTKKTSLFSDAVKNGDGITRVNDSDLIVSQWKGLVYYVKADGTANQILDLQAEHKNTADLFFLPEQQLLVIPTFTGNTVAAYTVSAP
ncbi:ATP-binding protein [Compostibacter hankyongensis]|uniref:SMP-30/gluconolactonase/LRE family protein n=1 Tax=Compostibacter hankyongensis TaxID=1007089 RepID=A0ABP8FFV8_9BACT